DHVNNTRHLWQSAGRPRHPRKEYVMTDERFEVLGIAGSLRRASYNRGLIRAAQQVAPEGLDVRPFDLLPIPPYNGDVEAEGGPEPVRELKERIRAADG